MRLEILNFERYHESFEYYKRKKNTFYFRDKKCFFDVKLSGKELFDFVDNYDIGDRIKV